MLPAGVRRRFGRRDAMLPGILMAELLAGMALGAVWPHLMASAPSVPQSAMTAVSTPTGAPIPLPPMPLPTPTFVPPPTHAPRNPFGAPQGIDTRQQQLVPVVPVPVAPHAPVPPPGLTVPVGPAGDPFAGVGTPAR